MTTMFEPWTLGFFLFWAVVIGLYLIPGSVAYDRKHRDKWAIIVLNILLGWTFLGWVGALVWALTNPKKE